MRAHFDTWPDVRIIVRPLPWGWRLRPIFYRDYPHPWGHASLSWLCVTIEWWAQENPRYWFVNAPGTETP